MAAAPRRRREETAYQCARFNNAIGAFRRDDVKLTFSIVGIARAHDARWALSRMFTGPAGRGPLGGSCGERFLPLAHGGRPRTLQPSIELGLQLIRKILSGRLGSELAYGERIGKRYNFNSLTTANFSQWVRTFSFRFSFRRLIQI